VVKKKINKIRIKIKEWVKAFFLAVLFTLFIKIFFIQSFLVSTTKMESTLLKGDFIMVNKLSYGVRLPITILSFPFTPKIYSELIQLPYFRLPALKNIKTNDIIVFNYPMQLDPPIDKKKIMVKRCVALPRDTIKIENKRLYINSIQVKSSEKLQFNYRFVTNGKVLNNNFLDKYGIREGGIVSKIGIYDFYLTKYKLDIVKKDKQIRYVRELRDFSGENTSYIFPIGKYYSFNKDNFGPIVIPFKGQVVNINNKTIELYKDLITEYEGNELLIKNSKIFINNKETVKYTIKKDYYFVLDDNRDNAKDSRYWGFLPEDYIVGKVSFVWFSFDKTRRKIRWSRIFKKI